MWFCVQKCFTKRKHTNSLYSFPEITYPNDGWSSCGQGLKCFYE